MAQSLNVAQLSAPAMTQAWPAFSTRPHGRISARRLVTVDLDLTDERALQGNKTGARSHPRETLVHFHLLAEQAREPEREKGVGAVATQWSERGGYGGLMRRRRALSLGEVRCHWAGPRWRP
jgi:hypothetical protein